jgi:hypothetical protein
MNDTIIKIKEPKKNRLIERFGSFMINNNYRKMEDDKEYNKDNAADAAAITGCPPNVVM